MFGSLTPAETTGLAMTALAYGGLILRIGMINGKSEQRFNSNGSAITSLQNEMRGISASQSSSSDALRNEIQQLNNSISSALQDNARAIGRLEGAQNLAKEIALALRNA